MRKATKSLIGFSKFQYVFKKDLKCEGKFNYLSSSGTLFHRTGELTEKPSSLFVHFCMVKNFSCYGCS